MPVRGHGQADMHTGLKAWSPKGACQTEDLDMQRSMPAQWHGHAEMNANSRVWSLKMIDATPMGWSLMCRRQPKGMVTSCHSEACSDLIHRASHRNLLVCSCSHSGPSSAETHIHSNLDEVLDWDDIHFSMSGYIYSCLECLVPRDLDEVSAEYKHWSHIERHIPRRCSSRPMSKPCAASRP